MTTLILIAINLLMPLIELLLQRLFARQKSGKPLEEREKLALKRFNERCREIQVTGASMGVPFPD